MLSTPPAVAPAVVVVPHVRAGSHADAKLLRSRLQQVLAGVSRASETLELLVESARQHAIHLMLRGPDGRYFATWEAFCCAPLPYGLGVPAEAIAAEAIAAVIAERTDPRARARAVLEGPLLLQTRSAPRKGRAAAPARGMEYTLQRLKRDRPDLLERVASGELTVQAAAELAGHRPPLAGVLVEPQSIARLIVSRLEPQQQEEVIRLVQHPGRSPTRGTARTPTGSATRRARPPQRCWRSSGRRRRRRSEPSGRPTRRPTAWCARSGARRLGRRSRTPPAPASAERPERVSRGLRRGALPLSSPASG